MSRTSLMIRPFTLSPAQKKVVFMPTPQDFIKRRAIRGGGEANYVEIGYVVARLNEAFSPTGWAFEVVDERVEEKEVVVRGKLTLKHHEKGYEISKTQYGTHPRYANVPLGDALKAATSDSIKKCASLLGVALDVYWPSLDTSEAEASKEKTRVKVSAEPAGDPKKMLEQRLKAIKTETNKEILLEWRERTMGSTLVQKVKFALLEAIAQRLKELKNE